MKLFCMFHDKRLDDGCHESCMEIYSCKIDDHDIFYIKKQEEINDFFLFPIIEMILCLLENTLSHHGVSYLHESGNVGTLDIVDVTVSLCTILHA